MLRAFSLALALTFAAGPSGAVFASSDDAVMAQQKPAPQTPRRDCEKNTEGIS